MGRLSVETRARVVALRQTGICAIEIKKRRVDTCKQVIVVQIVFAIRGD